MIQYIKNYLLNLNLFETTNENNEEENEEEQHKTNIIATRIYLLILIFILILVGIIFWLRIQTRIMTIHYPTKDQYQNLPNNPQCPCSRIGSTYGEFTKFETSFHQVCSSDFVSDRWIKTINLGSSTTSLYYADFRIMASAQFQALAAFCRLSNENIAQGISSFNRSALFSFNLLSENLFQSQTKSDIQQFQLTLPNTFRTQLQLLRQITFDNQLVSGLQTNFHMTYALNNHPHLIMRSFVYMKYDGHSCRCSEDINCASVSGIQPDFQQTWLMVVPGFLSGCLPVDSLLLSTLECFYNQTCLDQLMTFFFTKENFLAMSTVETSSYQFNSTVQSMIDQFMIEEWIQQVSYEKYYSQCAPISCTYTILERHTFVFILGKLISLLGGLTLVLKFLIPWIVRFLKRLRKKNTNTIRMTFVARLKKLKLSVGKKLIELNIFKSNCNNPRQVRYECIATRLYVIFLVISLFLFAIYTFFKKSIHYETISNPSESQYNALEKIYSTKLSCPCASMSISYSNFLQIKVVYHEICSSDLISTAWITYLSKIDVDSEYHPRDFRLNGASHFLSLRTFCQKTAEIFNNSLNVFYQTKLINAEMIDEDIFQSQMNLTVRNWKSDTTNAFLRTIQIIRATTQGNQLMNGFLNTDFLIDLQTKQTRMIPQTYGNCSCALSRSCRELMSIYEYNNFTGTFDVIHHISQFYVGCFLFESLLMSTLECFSNQSCMMEIDQYMYKPLRSSFNFSSLQSNDRNLTIESILSQMMIDTWLINISHSSFYQSCSPLSCSFEYISHNDIFFVLSTIIGVFGGLSLIWKIILIIGLRLRKQKSEGFAHLNLRNSIKNLFIYRDENHLIDHLHFLLVLIILCIVYAISAFTPQLETIEIRNPSLSIYEDLSRKYSDTLQCSCKEISIKYATFLQISAYFHEICSSEFISENWINALYGQGNLTSRYVPIDFFYSGFSQFQLLSSFCQLSQETVNNTLQELMNNDFVNTQLLSRKLFTENIKTIVNQFEITIPEIFLSTLSLIRETTGSNRIMDALSTSWMIDTPSQIANGWSAFTLPRIYDECNCALSPKCIISSRGMLTGCYPLEALFQSTFSSLYNHSNNSFLLMNISLHQTSRFNQNSTIESIINQLLVEEYLTDISYENYFHQCNASECFYLQIDKTNIIDGIIYLIALYGGLMIICRVFAVIIAKIFWSRKARIRPSSK